MRVSRVHDRIESHLEQRLALHDGIREIHSAESLDVIVVISDDRVGDAPSAHRVMVHDAGHVPWIDAPAATIQPLDRFLRQVLGPGAE